LYSNSALGLAAGACISFLLCPFLALSQTVLTECRKQYDGNSDKTTYHLYFYLHAY
jgi:hypothetical protein